MQIPRRFVAILTGLIAIAICADQSPAQEQQPPADSAYAEIHVIDSATGHGVPLVELVTVNNLRFVTDNAGRVAFAEPDLLDTEVFFYVRSHGYEVPKDGFGYAGVRVTPRVGEVTEIKISRTMQAERLCRLTGEGLYRDSQLLGYETPNTVPRNGHVAGQDSVQAAIYGGKVFWIWGDTSRMKYPLGLFRAAGATSPIPDATARDFDPSAGIPYEYFVDETGFARAMIPIAERPQGVVWIVGMFTVNDATGAEKLVAHYSRRAGLAEELEQGIAIYNDELQIFEPTKQLPADETWRRPAGHPVHFSEDGQDWILFGNPAINVRVPATLEAVLDPQQYEAFTCAASAGSPREMDIQLTTAGHADWRWQQDLPPIDSQTERQLVKAGKLAAEDARFCPVDASHPDERVILHSGTIRWNEHRQRWVLVAGQAGGKTSMLGEVWYAEAEHPTGPFTAAVHVASHNKQSFYNVCHHDFLDADGGRYIHFEGTYTHTFSGNPDQTPRYDYNQILYRLDLDSEELRAAVHN